MKSLKMSMQALYELDYLWEAPFDPDLEVDWYEDGSVDLISGENLEPAGDEGAKEYQEYSTSPFQQGLECEGCVLNRYGICEMNAQARELFNYSDCKVTSEII